MARKQRNDKSYTDSWYSLTANRLLVTQGELRKDIDCDVCVVGSGFTGLSAALELSQKGLSVVLLEARELASSVPGRHGGTLLRGFDQTPAQLISRFGPGKTKNARVICNAALEGLALLLERVEKHQIDCDLKFGHLTAALNDVQLNSLRRQKKEWDGIGHTDMRLIDRAEARALTGSGLYAGGLFDPKGARIHPLNYALGLAQAAQTAGCLIHDETPALEIITQPRPQVVTAGGRVTAKTVLLAGAVRARGAGALKAASIPATSYIIATEPLSAKLLPKVLPGGIAITDARHIPAYYHLSHDNRLLFGTSRLGRARQDEDAHLRKRMLAVFPDIGSARIAHFWHSPLDLTLSRLPRVGRLAPNVYFAHGLGGHGTGIILANIMGRILAEAITGEPARFDIFAEIRHLPLGPLKYPVSAFGALWDGIRDRL